MEPHNISCCQLVKCLDIAASTLNRILKSHSGISPEMARRLAKVLSRSPESWLAMQGSYNLALARSNVKLGRISKLNLDAVWESVFEPRLSN